MRATIVGSGAYLPPFVVDNERLAEIFPTGPFPEHGQPFDWGPAWIRRKLGINARRYAFDFDRGEMREGYYDLDLGEHAARQALEGANLPAEAVDAIIYVTSTPEHYMPDPACCLHERLGAPADAGAFALTSTGCGGFIYGMILGEALVAAGTATTVLLVGSVSTSSYGACLYEPGITPERQRQLLIRDRVNASLFGDGAGAIVLQATSSDAGSGIIATSWGATGANNPVIVEGGGSRRPAMVETVLSGLHCFRLDLAAVKAYGLPLFEQVIQGFVKKTGITLDVIDHFVFHQINARLLRQLATRLGIPVERVVAHVNRYGNLDTATLGVGFHEARTEGRIRPGDLVLFAAIGAGWQYGAALVRL